MLTPERLEVLSAVQAGTVTARLMNAIGSTPVYTPPEVTVRMGYLMRAGLVEVRTVTTPRGLRPSTVHLTERGERYLAKSKNTPRPDPAR